MPAEYSGLGDVITAPRPDGVSEAAVLYVLFCDGNYHSTVWVMPEDVIDLDAAIAAEAQRYVEDVLAPGISIGVNPSARGLVGLPSWFWVEGFSGSVTAPPITAFGMTVDVRLASGTVRWDFGDGVVEEGDLGQAYPAESSVQHIHQEAGEFDVTVDVELVPEYRVDGGPWLTLPNLSASATTTMPVEERQAVIVSR